MSFGSAERRLVGAGDRAHAAFDGRVGGQQFRQQVGEQIRVAQPFRIAPVRQVHVFLHAGPVERAVRKAVDGEDVHPVAREELAELGQHLGFGQVGGGARRQPQADAEVALGHQAVADRDHVPVEVGPDLGPRFPRMDVAAVGEVDAGAQIHAPCSRRRSQPSARRISSESM